MMVELPGAQIMWDRIKSIAAACAVVLMCSGILCISANPLLADASEQEDEREHEEIQRHEELRENRRQRSNVASPRGLDQFLIAATFAANSPLPKKSFHLRMEAARRNGLGGPLLL
ncbi:MAG: hypothetical protein N2C14_07405 [Planctomycetales bacterium]